MYLLVKCHQTKKINGSKQRLHGNTEAKATEDPTIYLINVQFHISSLYLNI